MNKITDRKDFNEKVISGTGLQIVKFYAEWSGPCQMMVPIYNEMSSIYGAVAKFHQVDIEQAPQLKKEFGVNEMPTILFYKNGVMIDFVTGLTSKNSLIAKFENVLNNRESSSEYRESSS